MMTNGLSIQPSLAPAAPVTEPQERALTAAQFHQLADVPPALTS